MEGAGANASSYRNYLLASLSAIDVWLTIALSVHHICIFLIYMHASNLSVTEYRDVQYSVCIHGLKATVTDG
jgi:hypothetical protein